MDIEMVLTLSILLFVVIYFSVRLAIGPLLNKPNEATTECKDFGLVKLRDIEVFNDIELEEVIELYQNKIVRKKNYEQYQKYERVLDELKDIGYFSDEQYLNKVIKLKKYFKID